MKKIIIMMICFVMFSFKIQSIQPGEILTRIDDNEFYDSIKYDGEMIINFLGRKEVKKFSGYAQGSSNAFFEFTNASDFGTRYLRKEGKLYVYSEDLEEIMPIVGHMLKESMMGSDMSYEDVTSNNFRYAQEYNAVITEETQYEGKEVWVLDLKARKKTAAYAKRKLWVNKETFLVLKEELYALSGVKLRINSLKQFQRIDNRFFPTEIMVDDLLRKNSNTVFIMSNITLNVKLPVGVFSLRNLEK